MVVFLIDTGSIDDRIISKEYHIVDIAHYTLGIPEVAIDTSTKEKKEKKKKKPCEVVVFECFMVRTPKG